MRRAFPPPEPAESLRRFELLQQEGLGLRCMLSYLPEGASLADAYKLYKKLGQQSRRPCAVLDGPLGVHRG